MSLNGCDTVRLMAPKFVAPYRMSGKRGKNDAADAAAIAEAVTGGGQARLTLYGIRLAMTTGTQWSPAARFVSGSAQACTCATRPTVDVQSVPRSQAPSSSRQQSNGANQETSNVHRYLTTGEVPVRG